MLARYYHTLNTEIPVKILNLIKANLWENLNLKDHLSWRSYVNKHMRMHYAMNHGDAYFVIPEYPFCGEGKIFKFLIFSGELQFLFDQTNL